jgi:hypothetical protein
VLGAAVLVSVGLSSCVIERPSEPGPAVFTAGDADVSCVDWPEDTPDAADSCRAFYDMPATDLLAVIEDRLAEDAAEHDCRPTSVPGAIFAVCAFREAGGWSGEALVVIAPPAERAEDLEDPEQRDELARGCCSALEAANVGWPPDDMDPESYVGRLTDGDGPG